MKNKRKDEKLTDNIFVKGLFAIVITAVLLFSVVPAITFATNTDTTNTDNQISVTKAKAATLKVTWNGNKGKIGGKPSTFTSVKKGSSIKKLPATPKRVGYAFKGWYTKKSGGTKITTKTKPKKKVTYYAQWIKTYTLTFDPNSGKVTPSSKKIAKGKTYGALPIPTRSGYTFKGWYTSKTGGTKVSTTTKMPGKNTKIFAQWTKGSSTTNNGGMLSAAEERLVGTWTNITFVTNRYSYTYSFAADGTYIQTYTQTKINSGTGMVTSISTSTYNGSWSISGNIIYFKNIKYRSSGMDPGYWQSLSDSSKQITIGSDINGQYFVFGDDGKKYYKS